MLGGNTQICYGIFVTLCRITRVFRPAISGVALIEIRHDPIARDLGDYTRSCDGQAACIPFHDRLRHTWQVFGQAVAIDQKMIGRRAQFANRTLHGKKRRLKDIERVNLARAGLPDPDFGTGFDLHEQILTGAR